MAFNFNKYLSFIKAKQAPIISDRSVVGIDIGSSSIKVVQLKHSGKIATLITYGELQLGPYAGRDLGQSTTLSEQKLTQALVDIIRESSVTSKSGVLAIPYASSFMMVINIATALKEDLAPRIPVEVRKYIPAPLKEVALDWFTISSVQTDVEVEHTVLLAALHKDSLTKFSHIINGASMVEIASEIEVFSTIRAAMLPEDSLVIVVDFGGAATRIYIVAEGVVRRIHSIKTGGTALTEALAKEKNVSFEASELTKREYGLSPSPDATDKPPKLVAIVSRLGNEINNVIKRHERNQKETITKVILTGGGANLHGLDSFLRDMLSREVVIADPFAKIAYPAFMEDILKQVGPSFTVAIGVALREISR